MKRTWPYARYVEKLLPVKGLEDFRKKSADASHITCYEPHWQAAKNKKIKVKILKILTEVFCHSVERNTKWVCFPCGQKLEGTRN